MEKRKTTQTTKNNASKNVKNEKWDDVKAVPVNGKKVKWAGKC